MKLFLTSAAAMMGMNPSVLLLTCVIVLLVLTTLIVILSRYRKCPSDKVLVIYGKVGTAQDGSQRSAKCIHGGAAFIWPVIQAYEYLDLTPMSIQVDAAPFAFEPRPAHAPAFAPACLRIEEAPQRGRQ